MQNKWLRILVLVQVCNEKVKRDSHGKWNIQFTTMEASMHSYDVYDIPSYSNGCFFHLAHYQCIVKESP